MQSMQRSAEVRKEEEERGGKSNEAVEVQIRLSGDLDLLG